VLIDCDTCQVRGLACGDCVVTVLLGAPPEGVVLDDDERRALDVLAGSGLVPPLRLVESGDGGAGGGPASTAAAGPERGHIGRRRFAG
jgi:hypothetical protein